jgi:hypothetical protein
MKRILSLFLFAACISSSAAQQPAATGGNDIEIRKALCQIRNKDYSGAQKTIDAVLQADPQNLYARRLAPGIIAYQIKKNDRSTQNIAIIQKAISAYASFSRSPGISVKDQESADYEIASLAGLVRDQKDSAALVEIAENTDLSPLARSTAYVALAARYNICVNDLLAQKPRPTPGSIQNAKRCIEKGLEYCNKAIALRSDSESGFSYRASLLISSSKVAAMEGDAARTSSLKSESEIAIRNFKELSSRASAKQAEEDKEIASKSEPQPDIEELASTFAKDLTTYRSEKPLAKLVDALVINYELTSPDMLEGKPEVRPSSVRRIWKQFSPPGEGITAMLPSDVSLSGSRLYTASSDGVIYMISSVPRLSSQGDELTNIAINNLTWGAVLGMRNLMLMGDSPATYEVTLLRKEGLGGYPGKTYAATLDKCSGKDNSVLIVVVTNARNYAIQVIGAAEGDPRTSRFLRSIRFQ